MRAACGCAGCCGCCCACWTEVVASNCCSMCRGSGPVGGVASGADAGGTLALAAADASQPGSGACQSGEVICDAGRCCAIGLITAPAFASCKGGGGPPSSGRCQVARLIGGAWGPPMCGLLPPDSRWACRFQKVGTARFRKAWRGAGVQRSGSRGAGRWLKGSRQSTSWTSVHPAFQLTSSLSMKCEGLKSSQAAVGSRKSTCSHVA